MIRVEFDLNQLVTVIQANLNDLFKDVINNYLQKTGLQIGSVYFLANSEILKQEGTLESKMNNLNKQNNTIKIIVKFINEPNPEPKYFKFKDIICPTCYEPCRIKIENYKVKLYDCPIIIKQKI